MEAVKEKAILDLATEKIPKEQLLSVFKLGEKDIPSEVESILQNSYASRSKDDVELGLLLGFLFQFPQGIEQYIHSMIDQTWHESHEDMISILDDLKLPESVPFIAKAIQLKEKFEYLSYDDYGSFYKKCFYALYAIGTVEALTIIRNCTQASDDILRVTAEEMIELFSKSST